MVVSRPAAWVRYDQVLPVTLSNSGDRPVIPAMQNKNLPEALDTDQTANLAVTYAQAVFERHRWLFRRQEGRNDFGIDVEIEIVEKNLVTGRAFKGQVKGRANIKWTDGATSVSVNMSTYNLWKGTQVPVIGLLCDVGTKQIYWCLPISQVPAPAPHRSPCALRRREIWSVVSRF